MAGTQGPAGKPLGPKVAKPVPGGSSEGKAAPSGGGQMSKGMRAKPTNSKAKGPK